MCNGAVMHFGQPSPRVSGRKQFKRAGINIGYRPVNSEMCLYVIEALAEGTVLANIVEMKQSYPNFPGVAEAGIKYEEPRMSEDGRDQHIGTLSEVIYKGKATCLEATAISAALFRLAGHNAQVEIIPQLDAYGKPIDWSYHAIVRLDGDRVVDPTMELEGYPKVAGQSWWQRAGYCCELSAQGKPCKEQPDTPDTPDTPNTPSCVGPPNRGSNYRRGQSCNCPECCGIGGQCAFTRGT